MRNVISQIINILSMVAMAYFAVPKLLAMPTSVAGFQQFENAIPLDADFFRIFTGISEMFMVVLILYFAITHKIKIGLFAYAFLLVTMISALSLEFFARPEPKMLLVIIGIVLALFSLFQIVYLKEKKHGTN